MRWLCSHVWDVKARTVSKPKPNASIEGRGDEVLTAWQRAVHGFTSVVLTCPKCGAIETRTLLGEAVDL